MHEEPTTAVVQRYLDALAGDRDAEPIIRQLLERSVRRLLLLCATAADLRPTLWTEPMEPPGKTFDP